MSKRPRRRLPLAPVHFVGRSHERERARALLSQTPLVVLAGPGGIGKTALATMALRSKEPKSTGAAVFVPVGRGQQLQELVLLLVRELSRHAGQEDAPDWGSLERDPEEALEALMELAELVSLRLLIDDLHHLEGGAEELLSALSHPEMRLRAVVTTRSAPRLPWLRDRCLELRPLSEEALGELGEALMPEMAAGARLRIATEAQGSPWFFRHLLYAQADGASLAVGQRSGQEAMLEELPGQVADFVKTLALLERPVPVELLAELGPVPSETQLLRLQHQGWVERFEDGLRLHAMVAALLQGQPGSGRLAAVLLNQADPELQLEGFRLQLAANADAAIEKLEDFGEAFLSAGMAPRLFAVLARRNEEALLRWRQRCATEMGNATALESVGYRAGTSPLERLIAARAAYLGGESSRALELLGDCSDDAHRILGARCWVQLGNVEEAFSLLPKDSPLALKLRAHRGESIDLLGLRPQGDEATLDAAEAAMVVGQRELAEAWLREVLDTPRGRSASHHISRCALLLQAQLCLDAGDLERAEALLGIVRPYVRGTSVLRPWLLCIDVERRLLTGAFEGLAAVLYRLEALSAAPWLRRRAERLRQWHGWLQGQGTQPGGEFSALLAELEQGRCEEAEANAMEIETKAASGGAQCDVARAMMFRGEAMLLAGRSTERLGAKLGALADELASPRFRAVASFFEHFGEPAVLERLASGSHAPRMARRAQGVLRSECFEQSLEAAMAARIRESWAPARLESLPGEGAGWGVDYRERLVWLPTGRTVSLKRKPTLWTLLTYLGEQGGRCTKEQLVVGAWEERRYHPERHSPKIHMAVRSLRKLIEDEPASPQRLCTVEDGYALALPFRMLR